MNPLLNHKEKPKDGLVKAIYKDRWVNIAIKYDDYFRFFPQFVIPFRSYLLDKNLINFFYHRKGTSSNVVQLIIHTTQNNLELEIKPALFQMLNEYFGETYLLKNYNVSAIDVTLLDKKIGLDGIDLDNLKLIGLEDLYTSPITYSIGVQGGKYLSEMLALSSKLILEEIEQDGSILQQNEYIEKSLALNFIFLKFFIKSKMNQYQFLYWLFDSLFIQISEGIKEDLRVDIENSYADQAENLREYIDYIDNIIEDGEMFEDTWMNEWIKAVKKYKGLINQLVAANRLTMPYDVKDNSTITFAIDNTTYQEWQIAYFVVRTLNGQLGIGFDLELNMAYWLKGILSLSVE